MKPFLLLLVPFVQNLFSDTISYRDQFKQKIMFVSENIFLQENKTICSTFARLNKNCKAQKKSLVALAKYNKIIHTSNKRQSIKLDKTFGRNGFFILKIDNNFLKTRNDVHLSLTKPNEDLIIYTKNKNFNLIMARVTQKAKLNKKFNNKGYFLEKQNNSKFTIEIFFVGNFIYLLKTDNIKIFLEKYNNYLVKDTKFKSYNLGFHKIKNKQDYKYDLAINNENIFISEIATSDKLSMQNKLLTIVSLNKKGKIIAKRNTFNNFEKNNYMQIITDQKAPLAVTFGEWPSSGIKLKKGKRIHFTEPGYKKTLLLNSKLEILKPYKTSH